MNAAFEDAPKSYFMLIKQTIPTHKRILHVRVKYPNDKPIKRTVSFFFGNILCPPYSRQKMLPISAVFKNTPKPSFLLIKQTILTHVLTSMKRPSI
jgi:hypothetical protein